MRARDAELQIDHVVSVADGGTNDETNLTAACFRCNHGKKAQSQPKFARLEELRAQLSRLDYDWMSSRLRPVVEAAIGVLWELDAIGEALDLAEQVSTLEEWLSTVLKRAAEDLKAESIRWTDGEVY